MTEQDILRLIENDPWMMKVIHIEGEKGRKGDEDREKGTATIVLVTEKRGQPPLFW